MKAINTPVINEMHTLSDIIPLNTPLGMTISIGNICDFRCVYCGLSQDSNSLPNEHEAAKMMSWAEFLDIADQIAEFDEPIKQVCFCSRGETILNRHLPDMIRLLKTRNLARNVKIITNANQLTERLSSELLAAGLDVIKISLQGINASKYKEICGVDIDFEKFIHQIKYFFERRGTCKVQVKILDVALDDGDDDVFFTIFGGISDYVFIENCIGDMAKHKGINKFNYDLKAMKTCPMPFYTIMIEHNGDVTPCCSVTNVAIPGKKTVLANLYSKKLKQVWADDFIELQLSLLQKKLPENHICSGCAVFSSIEKPENYLDNNIEEITSRYIPMFIEKGFTVE